MASSTGTQINIKLTKCEKARLEALVHIEGHKEGGHHREDFQVNPIDAHRRGQVALPLEVTSEFAVQEPLQVWGCAHFGTMRKK